MLKQPSKKVHALRQQRNYWHRMYCQLHAKYISLNSFVRQHMRRSCNNCESRAHCQFVPRWGQPVRWNCPFYIGEDDAE